MATKQTAARILCATAAGTLALTGCSAPDDTAAPATIQRVSLTPQDTLAVTGAGHARALEMSSENTLRMTTSEHAATATTMRVNADTGEIDEKHQVIVPGAEDDPTFSMIDFDDTKIEETAAHAADLAEAKFISEQGMKPAERTHELSQEMYRSTFALDTLRARLGYGATQLYTVGGERDAHAMWQLGAGSTIGLIDATGEHADDANDSVTPLQGSFPTIERSVGICALDATDAADNTTVGDAARTVTTLDGNDVTTRSGVVISTSGSSALVPRDATSLEEMSVIQATLPYTLDDEQRTPNRGERLVLMGLGEIDCVTHPVTDGTPESTTGIFAAINTELATRTSDYQNSSNALRDYLDEQEQADTTGNDESPARPREDTAAITPVVPEEHGLVAVMDAQGDVAALLDSTEIAAAHPEVAGKDISTVAVDPATFNPTDTESAERARQGWFDRLLAPLRRDDDAATTEQTVTLWITYDGVDTVYKTQARLDI